MTRERRIVAGVAIATAITRWLAMARTFWDSDEARFMLALRNYDVRLHQPHPPGFPLYIATAKLFQAAGFSDFHALQAVNFLAAVLIVPVAYAFARALEFDFKRALIAAVMLAFFPNVVVFGGTAFSDVPAMLLTIAAATLFLGGRLELGAIVAALAIGYRPQNAIVLAIPWVVAARKDVRRALVAAAIGLGIVIVAYGAAAWSSGGWNAYREAVAAHQRFIAQTDSFGAAGRPPLINVIADFLIRPYRQPAIDAVVTMFAIVGAVAAVVRPRGGRWMVIAMFTPVAILSALHLDWLSASRFAIGFAPLIAMLASDGISVAARRFAIPVGSIVAVLMFAWTWPALRIVRSTVSPPVAALSAARGARVYVDSRLSPHATLLLPRFEPVDIRSVPLNLDPAALIVAEDASGAEAARNFTRPRDPLSRIVRPRYFDASVVAVGHAASLRGTTLFLPPLPGDGELSLSVFAHGAIGVRFNGRALPPSPRLRWRVLSRSNANNEVEVTGGRIVAYGWLPAF